MPQENLHMTAMEVTHSLTAPEVDALVAKLKMNEQHRAIADLPSQPDRRARLVKPMVGFDSAALALSFLPCDTRHYTYHHLRRELYEKISAAGVEVGSRYVVPSAHLTIARCNSPDPFVDDGEQVMDAVAGSQLANRQALMSQIDAINLWLVNEHWSDPNDTSKSSVEWDVGEEKGLDFRKGTLWYGGGETIYLGKSAEQ